MLMRPSKGTLSASMRSAHASEDQLESLIRNDLEPRALASVQRHLSQCAACRKKLESVRVEYVAIKQAFRDLSRTENTRRKRTRSEPTSRRRRSA